MMKINIIQYSSQYDEEVKDLLVDLQKYIVQIDKEKYNIVGSGFRQKYFEKTINEVNKYKGNIYLAQIEDKIVGLIAGYIYNETISTYDFKAPKRATISELVVNEKYRGYGIGEKLLNYFEDVYRKIGCKAMLIDCFAYNISGLHFYNKNGYTQRCIQLFKNL